MIFKLFDPNQDVVAGRTTRVASGFWPTGLTNWSQSFFVDDFWGLTGSNTPSPSFGTSVFDVRRTMYYENIFPDATHYPNDPYFSITYGNIGGNVGSGSFGTETQSIQASPTKAVYTQYKNMLLGTADLDGQFTMNSASTTVNASDIWVIDFSAYKMKDRIDEGLLELSFSGSNGTFTFIDDSIFSAQTQAVYQLITGSLALPPSNGVYGGIGLFYPANGVVVLNAATLAQVVGITYPVGIGSDGTGPGTNGTWPYNPGLTPNAQFPNSIGFTYNHRTLFESMLLCNQATLKIRKSEFVPARHYFVRVLNRDFNYSNNPTYVYDGTDGVHPKGLIRNADFISDPKTYITSVGLYNDNNELVAVAKLSRPTVKSFDSEILLKVRLDF
jgi:hypothetical protein